MGPITINLRDRLAPLHRSDYDELCRLSALGRRTSPITHDICAGNGSRFVQLGFLLEWYAAIARHWMAMPKQRPAILPSQPALQPASFGDNVLKIINEPHGAGWASYRDGASPQEENLMSARDEKGQALILALAFLMFFGLVIGVMLSLASASVLSKLATPRAALNCVRGRRRDRRREPHRSGRTRTSAHTGCISMLPVREPHPLSSPILLDQSSATSPDLDRPPSVVCTWSQEPSSQTGPLPSRPSSAAGPRRSCKRRCFPRPLVTGHCRGHLVGLLRTWRRMLRAVAVRP